MVCFQVCYDVVSVIATQPLTGNETWQRMKPGEYAIFHYGEYVDGNAQFLADIPFAAAKPSCQAPI